MAEVDNDKLFIEYLDRMKADPSVYLNSISTRFADNVVRAVLHLSDGSEMEVSYPFSSPLVYLYWKSLADEIEKNIRAHCEEIRRRFLHTLQVGPTPSLAVH